MTDFIIVGRGLAATVLAHTFKTNNLAFKVIGSPNLSHSSLVAAGIWNPIVFKRLTASWLAHQTVPFLINFYSECEKRLNKKFVYQKPILKPFAEEQEQNLWQKKSKNELFEFLGDIVELDSEVFKGCSVSGKAGVVNQSGNIDVAEFINETADFFKDNYIDEIFDHSKLIHNDTDISYGEIKARNIIFCEGNLVKNNLYFNWVPMKPAKGEVLTISSEISLNNHILNKGNFILQNPDGNFKTGATYEWDDLTEHPTQKGKEELEIKLKKIISAPYNILKHEAGIRPSSVDRRPVIGAHPLHKNIFLFNGLGTKGVMLAPYFANNFVLCYLQKQPLNSEADIKRFYRLYDGTK
ncbi:MAG: NAD(P)/FAD-dependent oxidoreductase [Bacteroidia bacterium]